jgi:hypothetical protein
MNFLGGKGVIKDLDINVDAINELVFQSSAPGLRFTRILVNTLSIKAPIMSLKSKPIVVLIDQIFVEISEIVEIIKKPKEPPNLKKSVPIPYGFLDRVVDALSVEVNRVCIAFKALGNIKTDKIGPWTPPILLAELCGIRFNNTNHNGAEVELDECLRVRATKRPIIFVYKKLDVKSISLYLINPYEWSSVSESLIHKGKVPNVINNTDTHSSNKYVSFQILDRVPFKILMCMRKRLDNNFLLGIEISIVLETVKITLRQDLFSVIFHFVIGLFYCLFRDDVIEEVYGPDPHNECTPQQLASLAIKRSLSPLSPMPSTMIHYNSTISKDQFEEEELASLEQVELEMGGAGATIADEREDWQRSSLDSDIDPPHCRIVIVFQADEILLSVPLDDILLPKSSKENQKDHPNCTSSKLLNGIVISVCGLCVNTIWPEHASNTESVLQVTTKQISINDYFGVQRSSLFRFMDPLDSKSIPVFINLLPRGIKEQSSLDFESLPGTCFIFKKENNWPPPPLGRGLSVKEEMCVCEVEITLKIDIIDSLISYIYGAIDPRWVSGEWGMKDMKMFKMHDAVLSGESVFVVNGAEIIIYPGIMNEKKDNPILFPAQLIIDIGLISLISKSSLNINFLLPMLGSNKNKNQSSPLTPCQDDQDDQDESFPFKSSDLCNALKYSKPINGVNLLSKRFEAVISELIISIGTNKIEKISLNQHKQYHQNNTAETPPRRNIVKPFSLTLFNSLDPHPFRHAIIPTSSLTRTPYNRDYYWPPNNNTIETNYIGVDNISIEISLLDLVKISQTVEAFNDRIDNCNALKWLSKNDSNQYNPADSYDKDLNNLEKEVEINSDFIDSPNDNDIEKEFPSKLSILRVRNIQLLIVKDEDDLIGIKSENKNSIPSFNYGHSSSNQSNIEHEFKKESPECILGLSIKHVTLILEKVTKDKHNRDLDSTVLLKSSSDFVLKGICSGVAITVCDRPFIIINSDNMLNSMEAMSSSSDFIPLQWLSNDQVISFRYEYNEEKNDVNSPMYSESSPRKGFADSQSHSDFNDILNTLDSTAILEVKFYKDSKIISNVVQLEILSNRMMYELLRGFGSIHLNPDYWWQDSIFGYIENCLDRLVGGDARNGVIVPVTKAQIDRVSKRGDDPILLRIRVNSFLDIVQVNIIPLSSKSVYQALITRLSNVNIIGRIRTGEYPLLKFKSVLNLQILIYTGCQGNHMDDSIESEICNSFGLNGEFIKVGNNPIDIRSSFVIGDIYSSLSVSNFDNARNIIEKGALSLAAVQRLIYNFWTIVESSTTIPVFKDGLKEGLQQNINNDHFDNRNVTSKFDVLLDVLRSPADVIASYAITKSILTSKKLSILSEENKNENLLEFEDLNNEFEVNEHEKSWHTMTAGRVKSQLDLSNEISSGLGIAYRDLKNMERLWCESTNDLSSSLSGILHVCNELEQLFDHIRQCALLAVSQSPIYCGWISRTGSFNKKDKSTPSTKCWAALTSHGSMYFMSQPYSRSIDMELSLDEVNAVISDPDDNFKIANGGKNSLSTCIHIINGENKNIVIDALTLNEKVAWLEVLSPWFSEIKGVVNSSDLKLRDKKRLSMTKGIMNVFKSKKDKTDVKIDKTNLKSSSSSATTLSSIAIVGEDSQTAPDKDVDRDSVSSSESYNLDRHSFEKPSSYSSDEVIKEIDHLQIPLNHCISRIKESSNNSKESFSQITSLLETTLENIGKSVMGTSSMKVISHEVC